MLLQQLVLIKGTAIQHFEHLTAHTTSRFNTNTHRSGDGGEHELKSPNSQCFAWTSFFSFSSNHFIAFIWTS